MPSVASELKVELLPDLFVIVSLEGQAPELIDEVKPRGQVVNSPALRRDQLLDQLSVIREDILTLVLMVIVAAPVDDDLVDHGGAHRRQVLRHLDILIASVVELAHDALQNVRLDLDD